MEDVKKEIVKEENKETAKPEAVAVAKPKAKASGLVYGLSAAVVVLAASTGFLGWQYLEKNDSNKEQSARVTTLQDELTTAKKDVSRLNRLLGLEDNSPNPTPIPTTTPLVSETMAENVAAAIDTMNTAALEGYMADSVYVIYAATEYAGSKTPAEAIADLDYLSGAIGPWDFNLDAATLASYAAGWYGEYFTSSDVYVDEDTHPHLVGQSSDGYVVSFCINEDGDIDGIFITGSSELLL
jgi:hypothetical protein